MKEKTLRKKLRRVYNWPGHCYVCEAPVKGTSHVRVLLNGSCEVAHTGICEKALSSDYRFKRITIKRRIAASEDSS